MTLSEGMQETVDGSATVPIRVGRDRGLMIQHAHARYQEAVRQGRVYTLSTLAAGVTIAAANVIAAANSQPLVGIYNNTTLYNAVIWRATAVWASGTAAAQGLVWGVVAPPSTGLTAGGVTTAALNNLTFLASSQMKQFVNSALTGATSALFRFMGGPTTGALAANANHTYWEQTDGDIIVPPGGCLGLFAAAAGTSPIVAASFTYEEVLI